MTPMEREMHRSRLWHEQEGECFWCFGRMKLVAPITDEARAELDHKVPRSRGGKDDMENLCLSHRQCNRAKSDSDYDVYLSKQNIEPGTLLVRKVA